MPKHLSKAQADALQASATSLFFDALQMVTTTPEGGEYSEEDQGGEYSEEDQGGEYSEEDRGAAVALTIAAVMTGAETVWSRAIIVRAAAVATAMFVGGDLQAAGAFLREWEDLLGVAVKFTPEPERKLQDFADMVARLETPDEFDQRTDGEGVSGDDAVDTIASLVEAARELSTHRPVEIYHFRADAPGHAAPEGGEL